LSIIFSHFFFNVFFRLKWSFIIRSMSHNFSLSSIKKTFFWHNPYINNCYHNAFYFLALFLKRNILPPMGEFSTYTQKIRKPCDVSLWRYNLFKIAE
jgi:hypothetical protein